MVQYLEFAYCLRKVNGEKTAPCAIQAERVQIRKCLRICHCRRFDGFKSESTFRFTHPNWRPEGTKSASTCRFAHPNRRPEETKSESTFRFDHANDDPTEPKGKALSLLLPACGKIATSKRQRLPAFSNCAIKNVWAYLFSRAEKKQAVTSACTATK